jgi:hypothetical protein
MLPVGSPGRTKPSWHFGHDIGKFWYGSSARNFTNKKFRFRRRETGDREMDPACCTIHTYVTKLSHERPSVRIGTWMHGDFRRVISKPQYQCFRHSVWAEQIRGLPELIAILFEEGTQLIPRRFSQVVVDSPSCKQVLWKLQSHTSAWHVWRFKSSQGCGEVAHLL